MDLAMKPAQAVLPRLLITSIEADAVMFVLSGVQAACGNDISRNMVGRDDGALPKVMNARHPHRPSSGVLGEQRGVRPLIGSNYLLTSSGRTCNGEARKR
jgi:hypothetical protein